MEENQIDIANLHTVNPIGKKYTFVSSALLFPIKFFVITKKTKYGNVCKKKTQKAFPILSHMQQQAAPAEAAVPTSFQDGRSELYNT